MFFCFCGIKQEKVEKISENGIEVILNHKAPYKLKGEPSELILEEVFRIDTENDEIAEAGLTDIREFNIDSEGNLFFLNSQNPENYYFKFDKAGEFVTAFGKRGQGPGEIQTTRGFKINHLDEVEVPDYGNRNLHVFKNNGEYVQGIPLQFGFQSAESLRNGNYLIAKDIADFEGEYLIQIPVVIYSPDFVEIGELDRMRIPNYLKGKKRKGYPPIFVYDKSDESIIFGNEERDYELWIYDFDGNLRRKIRKEYNKVKIPEEYKNNRLAKMGTQQKSGTYFPESFPPFFYFTVDESGRIFIVTFEQDDNSNNYIDIFNHLGVFIIRTTIKELSVSGRAVLKCRNNHLYFLHEKESGYKELIVYEMIWQ